MRAFGFIILCLFGVSAMGAGAPDRGILVADPSVVPRVVVRWESGDGVVERGGAIGIGAPAGGEEIGGNLRVYVALGGTRIETGAGHPKGLVVRVGLTKVENARALFDGIEPGSPVEILLEGVRLSEPVRAHPGTGLVHLKYALGDLEACQIPGEARNQYLLSDPEDTLGGRVVGG